MESNFKLVKGVYVSNLDGISQCYCVTEGRDYSVITINVSAENIDFVFRSLCKRVQTPGFLLLEHATNQNIEKELCTPDNGSRHKDIYYLDGLDYSGFFDLYEKYKELLVNDGMIQFGFGSHSGFDEVFVGKYKVFTIYADDVSKYIDELDKLGICRNSELKTVWENFTLDTPGKCALIHDNGKNIYDMVEELKERGLYLAERREG